MPNSKSLGNCSTLMVFPPTCPIKLFVNYSTISSNPNHLSSQFPRKSSILAFLSLVPTPFRFALRSHVFAVLFILTLTFILSFALLTHLLFLSLLKGPRSIFIFFLGGGANSPGCIFIPPPLLSTYLSLGIISKPCYI